jgi:hypothetical protein
MGEATAQATEAWAFVRSVLDDMTAMVRDDAETPEEELEGLRVLARVTALCAELSVDVDPELPFAFPMSTPLRQVGGPVAAEDPGVPNWLDTGGRHRGFVTFRWLDRPEPPPIEARVVPLAEVAA